MFIVFANGSVWTANFIQGTVSRIDPRTNTVTWTAPIAGTPQGIAADENLAWASAAGGSRTGALPASACSKVESGGRAPDVLIASDLPLQGGGGQVARSMADAIRFVLRRSGYRAGKYTIGYQSCDDSTAQFGGADYFKCATNAKAYSQAADLTALIGPYNSYCTQVELPILNRASAGSIPMISPANTETGLTRAAPGVPRNQPHDSYPTGVRNFVRVVPPDDLQGAADAVFAKQLGLRKVYVLRDDYLVLSSGFMRAARRIGLPIAGSAVWPARDGYAALADRAARSGADGAFLGGAAFTGGDEMIKALRARLGKRFPIIVTDAFLPASDLLKLAGPSALGTYLSFPGIGRLTPRGKRLMQAFTATQPGGTLPEGTYVPQTLQAAELVLAAIARSDGTRASVLRELQGLQGRDGMLGPFRFDGNGDVTPEHVTIFRVTGRTPRSANLISDFEGSVPFRTVSVPTSLIGCASTTKSCS
jgi:branched-chain amino acid transport system substrate-binding protein